VELSASTVVGIEISQMREIEMQPQDYCHILPQSPRSCKSAWDGIEQEKCNSNDQKFYDEAGWYSIYGVMNLTCVICCRVCVIRIARGLSITKL
jgi:hypothetical protein